MITAITPEQVDVDEYESITLSYGLTYDDITIPPSIEEVIVTFPGGQIYTDEIVTTITSFSSFTITGRFVGIFDKEVHFIGSDKNQYQVNDWDNVPLDFDTVFKFKAPNPTVVTMIVTAYTTDGSISSLIDVNSDWVTSHAQLRDYIQRGKY